MKMREKKSSEIKKKIIHVARDLILRQGYQQTTIRQIIESAGVSTSSLYHFFQNKDDIFLSIVFDIYIKSIHLISITVNKEDDAVFLYALGRAVELKTSAKYHNMAQTFLDVYSSWRISEKVTKADIERCKQVFQPFTKKFTDEDYYVRNLALRGMRLSFIAECANHGGENFEKRWPFLVETDLRCFNVPNADIKKIIEKIAAVMNKKSFNIAGLIV